MARWIGACVVCCTCDKCWDQGDECGHNDGTCTLTPLESFYEALADGRVAFMDDE